MDIEHFSLGSLYNPVWGFSGENCYASFYCETNSGYTTTLLPGGTYPFAISYSTSPFISQLYMGIRCDWNEDGDFNDQDEWLYSQYLPAQSSAQNYTASITVPSFAAPGDKRLRVILAYAGLGETEDYRITVSSGCPATNTQAANFSAGLPFATSATLSWTRGDGDSVIVLMRQGAAVTGDPKHGQSYSANPVFGNGSEIWTGNYVVYSGTGTSVEVTGLMQNKPYHVAIYEYLAAGPCYKYLPLTGSFIPDDHMSYLSSTVDQVSGTGEGATQVNAYVGENDQPIIRLLVLTSGSIAPKKIDRITFKTAGTEDLSLISAAKIYYTNTPLFSPANLFGTAIASPTGEYTINGLQMLSSGENYFWLAYDIVSAAEQCNDVDGQIQSFHIVGESFDRTAEINDPTGSGNILIKYCKPTTKRCEIYIERITNFKLGSINNISGANIKSCYSDYFCQTGPGLTTKLNAGGIYSFSLTYPYLRTHPYYLSIWCDLDDDGEFGNGETLFSRYISTQPTEGIFNDTLMIPVGAAPGDKRLRVRMTYNTNPGPEPCTNIMESDFGFGEGETEDYKVTLLADSLPHSLPDLLNQADLHLYPNPTSEYLMVILPENFQHADLEIYSATGALVKRESGHSTQRFINLKNQPSGLYLVKCSAKNHVMHNRFVMN
jgi:hypothetical protein